MLDGEEESDMTRPNRYAYDSFLQPSSSMQTGADDELSASAFVQRSKPAFASFMEPSGIDKQDGLKFDLKDELNEKLSARLEEAIQPGRTMSHFVELNDNNGEDMLLEDIEGEEGVDNREKQLNNMLLDEMAEEPDLERDDDDDELLI